MTRLIVSGKAYVNILLRYYTLIYWDRMHTLWFFDASAINKHQILNRKIIWKNIFFALNIETESLCDIGNEKK